MKRERLIETFNTHRMSTEVVQAVATARELELTEAMQTVRQAASQPQQTAQHLIIYGERGSGKSFLMRMIEIEIERLAREEKLQIVPALLPEEQYNIRSAPQLIRAITAKVRGADWQASAFSMDFRPQTEAWDSAVFELNEALDQRFGKDSGLVVAMVENFDILARNLFGGSAIIQKKTASARAIEQSNAEQLLRKLMNRKGSRLMLIAAATGTVDQDYERPLFQAFKTIDLRIWNSDDCIEYFNRRRSLEQQAALSSQEEARARAIAEFIGGNPRLAQLLGDVLTSPDARSIIATLDELCDHLADYYRNRIDDLPQQSAALLDALIRKGEPCTQTELAERVGASSQAQIADAFSYLQSSRLLAANPNSHGAGKLYRLRDRLFVHFYRRRYSNSEKAAGLAPIAELLESFFTQREREQYARMHLEAGEWADARLYALNSPFMTAASDGFCWYRDEMVTGIPGGLFHLIDPNVDEALKAQIELKLRPELAVKHWNEAANRLKPGLNRTAAMLLEANALCRCRMDNEAEAILMDALHESETNNDIDSQILALSEIYDFVVFRQKEKFKAFNILTQAEALAGQAQNDYVRVVALHNRLFSRTSTEKIIESLASADEIINLAQSLDEQRWLTNALKFKAYCLSQLERYQEALSVAKQAADQAKITGQVHQQINALELVAYIHHNQGQFETAEAICNEAIQLAVNLGDEKAQSLMLFIQAETQLRLNRPEQALDTARESAKLANKINEPSIQTGTMLIVGRALNALKKHDDALISFDQAFAIAKAAGLKQELVYILNEQSRTPGQKASERTLILAQEIIQEISNTVSTEDLRAACRIFFTAAAQTSAPDLMDGLETYLATFNKETKPSIDEFDEILAAIAHNDKWEEFTNCLSLYSQPAQFQVPSWAFGEVGKVWSEQVKTKGRAPTYANIARQLPYIVQITQLLTNSETDACARAKELITGLLHHCDNAGFLEDMAELLDQGFGDRIEADVQRLRAFAQVHATSDKEKVLQRLDPDLALAIRRILNLPEPKDLLAQKGRRKGR